MEIRGPPVLGANPREPPLCQKAEIFVFWRRGEERGQGVQLSEAEAPDPRVMPGQTLTQKAEERTTAKHLRVFVCPQSQLKA